MRIIHTSDLHLSSALNTFLTGEKIRERKGELFASFDRMVEEAVRLGVGAIIIAGDLFDSDKITTGDCKRVIGTIERYPNITYFYVAGNHERGAFVDRIIDKPKNLIVFGEEWEYYTTNDICIIGRSQIEAGMFQSLVCEDGKKNIVILHGEPTEKSSALGIGLREAGEKPIDYLALGHYHSYGVYKISNRGIAVYPGTPEGRGFDEVGEKGFVLIDTDGQRIKHSFIPFAKRTIHHIKMNISGAERRIEVEDRILERLSGIPKSDLVRVELVGHVDPGDYIDIGALSHRFVNNYYHFEIKNNTRVWLSPESYRFDKSLRGEFVRLLNEANDLTEEERGLVALMGIRALGGEGLDMWEESI